MSKIKTLRLQRGWSQEQFAGFSGLSTRTIQRIERGQKPGLESLKSLAAVFETSVAALQTDADDNHVIASGSHIAKEQSVTAHVQEISRFYSHLVTYVVTILCLFAANYIFYDGYIWAGWPALGWGIAILRHGLSAFHVLTFFGSDWEQRQIEKRLKRETHQ